MQPHQTRLLKINVDRRCISADASPPKIKVGCQYPVSKLRQEVSHIESEVTDVTILHDVGLAFQAEEAF